MANAATEYDDEEWRRISEPPPLADIGAEDLGLLHRHWLWANQQGDWFYELLPEDESTDPGLDMYLAERTGGSMVVWYALLWSVIEALRDDRNIDLRDPLGRDINEIADLLRRARNATLHVPRSGDYLDQRIVDLITHPDSARLIIVIHGPQARRATAATRSPMAGDPRRPASLSMATPAPPAGSLGCPSRCITATATITTTTSQLDRGEG